NSRITVEDVEDTILEFEDTIFGRLPARLITLLDFVDGEILIGQGAQKLVADGGETELQLGLFPVVEDSVRIYVNYIGSFTDRNNGRELEGVTVNPTTGAVTLPTALREGDTVVATYRH